MINQNTLKRYFSSGELNCGEFGIEREGIRVLSDGQLATTLHPQTFGNPLKNSYITTDFSENQMELITPSFCSAQSAYHFLNKLCQEVALSLPENEYFWTQSMPSICPKDKEIPIAQYEGGIDAEEAMVYRQGLLEKYGAKKQLISGIHLNFSFCNDFLEKLRIVSESELDSKTFKNEVYLKITRNYLQLRWLIIYLTGCSVGIHETYDNFCGDFMHSIDTVGSLVNSSGVSIRNSAYGYKNLVPIFPDYTSIDTFVSSVQKQIEQGTLSNAKELYSQIRLKTGGCGDVLKELPQNGIKYLEIRTLDLNPFEPCGIAKEDIKFMQSFILYLLVSPEVVGERWQEEALENEEKVAKDGRNPHCMLSRNQKQQNLKVWGLEILMEMKKMDEALGLKEMSVLEQMEERIVNPKKLYSEKLEKMIRKEGFISSQMKIAMENKAFYQSQKAGELDYGKNI